MTSSIDRYGDLRAIVSDDALDAVLDDLHAAYTAPTPPPELRAAIRRLEATGQARSLAPVGHPVRGLALRRPGLRALAVVGVLAAVIATGAVIVVPNLAQRAMSRLPGGVDRRYVVSLHQSRRACGFTITLQRAYADANRLLIGYTVSTPPRRRFDGIYAPILQAIDPQGRSLEPLNSADTADMGLLGATNGVAQEFDTSALPRGAMLRLHLMAPRLYGAEIVNGRTPATPACEQDGAIRKVLDGGSRRSIRGVTIPGPFDFTIAIPFSPKLRMAAPHLSETSRGGTTITLERIRVTPTEARLYVRGPANRFFWLQSIAAGGVTVNSALTAPVGHGVWVVRFFPYRSAPFDQHAWLYDVHGLWTIKVLTDYVSQHGNGHWGGAVTFKLRLP